MENSTVGNLSIVVSAALMSVVLKHDCFCCIVRLSGYDRFNFSRQFPSLTRCQVMMRDVILIPHCNPSSHFRRIPGDSGWRWQFRSLRDRDCRYANEFFCARGRMQIWQSHGFCRWNQFRHSRCTHIWTRSSEVLSSFETLLIWATQLIIRSFQIVFEGFLGFSLPHVYKLFKRHSFNCLSQRTFSYFQCLPVNYRTFFFQFVIF